MNRTNSTEQDQTEMKVGRRRDSVASKQALFEAARTLFSQKGFERTTTREIGDLAGIDAALIARYFGNKANLYVATVVADRMADQDAASAEGVEAPYRNFDHIAEVIIRRSDEFGLGPIVQALMRLDTTDEIRAAARERLTHRLIDPLSSALPRGADDPVLRAQIAISALLGVVLARTLGWFDEIQLIPRDRLVGFISDAAAEILKGINALTSE